MRPRKRAAGYHQPPRPHDGAPPPRGHAERALHTTLAQRPMFFDDRRKVFPITDTCDRCVAPAVITRNGIARCDYHARLRVDVKEVEPQEEPKPRRRCGVQVFAK